MGNPYRLGQDSAETDIREGCPVFYVYRPVSAGEKYPGSPIELRDAGSDAVSPEREAFIAGYNSIILSRLLDKAGAGRHGPP